MISALDWQSLPERLCSRTPASTVLYRTGHSVKNYSFAVVLCVSESVKDIFRLHACLQDSSLFPHLLITTWPSTTADYGSFTIAKSVHIDFPVPSTVISAVTSDHISCGALALDWQSLPERLCSRTPASTVLYRTGHSVKNYSFAVVLCVSESVKDIFRLHACLQDSSLFPHLLITTWPSTTADYG
ncbi:hypothetical protein J6590_064688 [Homalodisca vitripennis]|nr:hypothetical protein J6590_064688 [Homalodisca vitripennis]